MYKTLRAAVSKTTTTTIGRRLASTSSTTTGYASALLAGNAVVASILLYAAYDTRTELRRMRESLDFGMDRIDECLNRIDLRNNETTGYFQTVSDKVAELERQDKKKSK